MTKYSGIIRLEEKPYQIIKWFTQNFDKEIGAVGVGRVEQGEIVVEKLVFPKQIVNGVHVHFKPEDWAPIMTELTDDELSRVIFYWHKHPDNSPTASQGDEDDTFDVFMDETSEREIFGFLQTANSNNGIKFEGRIEMRKPIWCSITDVEIITDESEAIEAECKEIIEKKVTVGHASASDQPGSKGVTKYIGVKQYGGYDSREWSGSETKGTSNLDEVMPTFEVKKKNGGCQIIFDLDIKEYVDMIVEYQIVTELVSQKSYFENSTSGLWRLFPKKGQLDELFKVLENQVKLYEACVYGYMDINEQEGTIEKISDKEEKELDGIVCNNIVEAAKGNMLAKTTFEYADFYDHRNW